jgi:hypothetical protein
MRGFSRSCCHISGIFTTLHSAALLLICLVHFNSAHSPRAATLIPEEKDALLLVRLTVALYSAIREDQHQLLPWDPGADPCRDSWIGVECSCSVLGAGCRVTSLNLSPARLGRSARLYGRLPDVFDQLRALETIDVSSQQLSGQLPSTIISHPFLKRAFLQENLFFGEILHNDSLVSASLEVLNVGSNMLSGPVNSQLCSLHTLQIANNPSMCGQVPICLRRSLKGGVEGTGLLTESGMGRQCSVKTTQCTGVPLALPWLVRESVGLSDGTHCTMDAHGSFVGSDSFNITFSSLKNVDALVLSFTGLGALNNGGWFWITSEMHSRVKERDAPRLVSISLSCLSQYGATCIYLRHRGSLVCSSHQYFCA